MDGRFIGLELGAEGVGVEGGSETLPYFFPERRRAN